MQVSLGKELEDFVVEKVQSGGYASADEVIREAVRDFKAKSDPAESDSEELAELLLAAVRGPHRPLKPGEFDELRAQVRGRTAA
ncbi:MAG TPA: type II toxin-antitoxin system ParD family antitoxin [Verrucomicrobiae bacterium]|jgi:putative addiction module CopG family antidote